MRLPPSILIPIVAFVAFSARSAPQDRLNNDYYTNPDRGMLYTVEKYHLYPGEEKMREKHYFAAYADFRFILGYFPNHPNALLLMAEVCEAWKSPKCDVDEFFDRAVARNPNIPATFVIVGIHQERTKRFAAAIESFKRALAINPNSLNANYNIALAYLDSGQYELANEHAQKAYALGAQLGGLRDRLKSDGHWQPLDPQAPQDESTNNPPSPPAPGSGNGSAK